MNPQHVRYIQDSIARKFRCGRMVEHTTDMLKIKEITPDDIPPIRVFEMNGHIHTEDNRRLYAFKKSGILSVPVVRILASQVDPDKFSKRGDGLSIVLRGR